MSILLTLNMQYGNFMCLSKNSYQCPIKQSNQRLDNASNRVLLYSGSYDSKIDLQHVLEEVFTYQATKFG